MLQEKLAPHKRSTQSWGYSQELYVASFAGFVPVDKPRVVIAVAVDEPTEIHTGGKVAAPVFSEIAAAAMLQLGIAPDPNAVEPEVAVQDNLFF